MSHHNGTLLRPMRSGDLDLVLKWRNHVDVRRQMFTSHEIAPTEHASWFARVSADSRWRLLVLERDGAASGFVQFGPIDHSQIAPWGFYTAPGALEGTGAALGTMALARAFGELDLHKIWGETLAENVRSISFHLKLGFREEGRFISHHFDGRKHRDVVRFGLLAEEWRNGPQINV